MFILKGPRVLLLPQAPELSGLALGQGRGDGGSPHHDLEPDVGGAVMDMDLHGAMQPTTIAILMDSRRARATGPATTRVGAARPTSADTEGVTRPT